MGMFDSVLVKCPKCKATVDFQSKAGPCELKEYKVHSVPTSVAISLNNTSELCKCGHLITLVTDARDIRVPMYYLED